MNSPQARADLVQTRDGAVRGVATAQARAFLGIPFAAPPVGALRFQPPAPAIPWRDVRDATRPGPICVQKSIPGAGRQSEDCLTLNVYAPAGADPSHPRPVMVWIYGGGFAFGDNQQYDPLRLAERQGVVVVAANYRLGALGFMAHAALRGAGEGAYALLDQQAALRWVRDNIAAFGGDPANVTLFGESAGAWSACYQLTAPGAQGLFRRAILESGACTSPDSAVSMTAAETGGTRMAAELGCADPVTAADCLRRLPARTLIGAKARRRGLLGKSSWAPMFGGDTLPLSPRAAFEAGRFAAVPVIDGTNREEGRLFLDFGRLLGRLWTRGSYEHVLHDFFLENTAQVIAEYEPEARRSVGQAYADVVTDATFACPALTLDALLERRAPVYAYAFDDPEAPFDLPRAPFTAPLGAYHSSEIAYVFQTRWALSDPAQFDAAQTALSDRMQAYWGSFARDGRPVAADGAAWPQDAGGGPFRLTPAGDGVQADFAAAHHCGFWRSLGY